MLMDQEGSECFWQWLCWMRVSFSIALAHAAIELPTSSMTMLCGVCAPRIRTTIMTASLLPGVMFATMLCLNAISLSYGTINTVPFSMMVTMVFTWLLVSFPLVVAGAIVGR